MADRRLTVALAGNPNSGKTTVFNALTGSRQHVGNYPGVTVETKQGTAEIDGTPLEVVDLPGTYSLTPYSAEEIVARDFLIEARPDVIIDVLDASNLQRSLYMATQMLELGVPLVLALNMFDLAQARGMRIDVERLSALLGVPIVPTVATRGEGLEELLRAAAAAAGNRQGAVAAQRWCDYGREVEPHVRQMTDHLASRCPDLAHRRWFAVKLLEGDEQTDKRLCRLCPAHAEELLAEAARLRQHIERVCGDSSEIILADRRYGFISGACAEAVRQSAETRRERSDRIDAVLTHRFLGLPIFALMMYLVFQITFWIGNPLVGWLEQGKAALAAAVHGLGEGILVGLLADGIIEGVGAVLVFVPLIALLYLAIAVLEDTGYMARAAFLLDGLMHRIGLHGKSFIPMLIGFSCTVPAVLATRIIETRRDRLTTILVLPLMSCGARLPVYALILAAFFPPRAVLRLGGGIEVTNQGLLLFGVYVAGIVLAMVFAKVFRGTILRGEAASFVLELPPYRIPALKGLLVHTGERTWIYVRKAGTIILAIVVILWALKTWPGPSDEQRRRFDARRAEIAARAEPGDAERAEALKRLDREWAREQLTASAIGRIGQAIAPVLRPCGFDWRLSTALLGAFAAKEVFISQMGIVYAVAEDGGETLRQHLAADYTPLQGLCVMLFILVASPCLATVAVTVREAGSWRWAALQWGYLTALAWILTALLYQIGRLVT